MNISKASQAAGLPVKTVRYYADIGLVPPRSRSPSGYRSYDRNCIRKLIFVRRARQFGFSVDICRELLSLYEDEGRTAREVKSIAQKRLEEIRKKRIELERLYDELSHLVAHCTGDERPDCPIIDKLSAG